MSPAGPARTVSSRRLSFLQVIVLTLASLVVALGVHADAPPARSFTLSTADTTLVLEAGEGLPKVESLSGGGITWIGQEPAELIDRVMIRGRWQPVQWKLESAGHVPGRVTMIYDSAAPHLRLEWSWEARAHDGPIEHTFTLANLEDQPVMFPVPDTLNFAWKLQSLKGQSAALRQMWIEKGAGKPSDAGTHEVAVGTPYRWVGGSGTYAPDTAPGEAREIIPWTLVETAYGQRAGWYLGVEFSGRARLTLARDDETVSGEAGLNPEPRPAYTRVGAGERFTAPKIFLGTFAGNSEAAGNILRRWASEVLLNPADRRNKAYPLLVNNSWSTGMGINEGEARGMIEDASGLGFEMFHLDAGWFRGVGDWYPHPSKFPHGIDALADYAHQHGLKFGLWVDWTQAGTDTGPGALNVHDPNVRDWLTRDVAADWKPEDFKGVTIDIGDPRAQRWCARELERLVASFHLDMLEHDGYLVAEGCVRTDHPHVACDPAGTGPAPLLIGPCSTDVSYHAADAYDSLYEGLRRRHPDLLLEACNDGGRMVDFGTAAHTDYFSITDSYDPLSNRRAFYDASHALPAAMLECYIERRPAPHLGNFLYALRSGMMGWCTVMQDTRSWTPEQRAAARQAFALYKRRLRPLIRDADLYHISPRPDGVHWDGIEYFDRISGRGVVFAFRGSAPDETRHAYVLQGLRSDRSYRVHFEDHAAPDRVTSGRGLMASGLTVTLPLPESSELVFVQELRKAQPSN
jgi:alpha-galactosidase